MIKATVKTADGGDLVVIGLTDANVREMKKDRPVLFCLSELNLGGRYVCISYKHANGNAAFPVNFDGIGLAFNDRALEGMVDGKPVDLRTGSLHFCVFRGADEQTIEGWLRPLIDHETKVTRAGFAPSDVPPGRN